MDTELVKGKPLTKEETKALLELIEASKIINNKTTNATNNKLKIEEWNHISERFNALVTSCRRTPQQLRLKWENLKKNARKRTTKIRMNSIKTGGGTAEYIPPDDILDRVASLLGSTASGFEAVFGGDRSVEANDACGGGGGEGGEGAECGSWSNDARLNLEMYDLDVASSSVGVVSSPSVCKQDILQDIRFTQPRKILYNSPKMGNGNC